MPGPTSASKTPEKVDNRLKQRWEFHVRQQRRRHMIGVAVLLSVLITAKLSDASLSKVFDRQGWHNAVEIFHGIAHPDLSASYLRLVLQLSIDSVLIGVLGTALAVI